MSFGRIEDFALERFFARWEFSVRHQLSASDIEPLALAEVLALADADARARWDSLSLGYTESLGLPALRSEIARLHRDMEPTQIVVLSGAEEGILLAMLATLDQGDEAVVVTPAYQSLHAVPRSLGVRVAEVRLHLENAWQLDPRDVARAVTSRTRIIAINFPHNPTGAHITAATQRALVDIADEAGAILFSDEVYRGLEYRSDDLLPAAAELSPSAASLGVMSKSFALAGLRIGWIATRNTALLDRVARLKDYTTICNSAPAEVLALIALRARERVLSRSREIVRANLECARSFVNSHVTHIEWVEPRAGSVAFPRFREMDASDVSSRLARSGSTLLIPGGVFGADPRHFRLGLGRKDLSAALEALELEFRAS